MDGWSSSARSDVESLEWTNLQAIQRIKGGIVFRKFSAAPAPRVRQAGPDAGQEPGSASRQRRAAMLPPRSQPSGGDRPAAALGRLSTNAAAATMQTACTERTSTDTDIATLRPRTPAIMRSAVAL